MKSFSFPRKERIKGTTQPSLLFHNGSVISESPLLCRYLFSTQDPGGIQVLFAVPKKRIKGAVERNRIRRRMREAWRLNVGELREKCMISPGLLQVGIYFQANEVLSYQIIETKIKMLIHRLLKHHETSNR